MRRYGLLHEQDRVVVGVSGGPDSVALILALCALKKELRLNLFIAHLDHKIRKNSISDLRFVK